jgi:hypothetical protein
MRVLGRKTRARTERNVLGVYAPTTDHASLTKDLSVSISAGTRKMVNYACIG